jgi:hypothetical protein
MIKKISFFLYHTDHVRSAEEALECCKKYLDKTSARFYQPCVDGKGQ